MLSFEQQQFCEQ